MTDASEDEVLVKALGRGFRTRLQEKLVGDGPDGCRRVLVIEVADGFLVLSGKPESHLLFISLDGKTNVDNIAKQRTRVRIAEQDVCIYRGYRASGFRLPGVSRPVVFSKRRHAEAYRKQQPTKTQMPSAYPASCHVSWNPVFFFKIELKLKKQM